MRGFVVVTIALVCFGAAFSLPPDTTASLLTAATESPALANRLQHPWNAFLLNGENSLDVGDLFYAEQRFSADERFALMPMFPILPAFAADSDTARAAAGWDGSGEAGHSDLPFARAFLRSRVFSNTQVAWEGDQDDLYSDATSSRRAAMLGDRPPSDAAYYGGEDLPPLSMMRGGVEMRQRGGVMDIGYSRGYVWSSSPLTGESYPLEAQGSEIQVGMDQDMSMHFRYYQFSGLATQPNLAPDATLSEIGLHLAGGEAPTWGWSLAWAYRKRVVEAGSAWSPMNRTSYPWQFRAGRIWTSDDSSWNIRVHGSMDDDESVLLSTAEADAEEPVSRNVFTQGLRIYHRHSFDGSAFISESNSEDTALTAGYAVPPNGRGAGAWMGYAWRDSLWETGVRATGSMEWETPIFVGTVWPQAGSVQDYDLSRYGIYTGSDNVLSRTQAEAYTEAQAGKNARLRASAGWQEFLGQDAGALEFSPAPYYGTLEGRFNLPDHVRIETDLQGMGPKYYRGYGLDWRIAPHFENQLGLQQSFWGNRLAAHVALFHAFGNAIREHPLGNPIRFRLTAGLTGKLP